MKKIYNLVLMLAAFAVAAVSCTDKAEYEQGEPEVAGCYGVYFPTQSATGSHTYDPTADKKVTVTVARKVSKGAITVPVTVTSNVENVFKVGEIQFADGQTETTVDITFEAVELGKESAVSLTITDPQYAAKYTPGAISFDFSVLCVEYKPFLDPVTNKAATVTFTVANIFQSDIDLISEKVDSYNVEGTIEYYEINGVRYCNVKTADEKGLFLTGAGFTFLWHTGLTYPTDGMQALEIVSQDAKAKVRIEENGPLYPIYIRDYYNHYIDNGSLPSTVSFASFLGVYAPSYPLSYYDGNGCFYFRPVVDIEGTNRWYGMVDGGVIGIASGFVRTDYTIDVETDLANEGNLPVYLDLGSDVEEVKYGIYEGALSANLVETKVEELTESADAKTYVVDDKSGFSVKLDSTGVYTIVATSFAEGKYQGEYAYKTFSYVTAEDSEANAPVITVGTEDVSGRYASLKIDKTNAFAFYVVGEDLTEVHMGVVETSKYKSDVARYHQLVKTTASLALTDEELEAVNDKENGGLADMYTKLAANTSYSLIVWASNGLQEKVVVSEYTTSGLPNEVLVDGTGTYAYNVFFEKVFGGYSLEYNPNNKYHEIPDWAMGVTYKFTVSDKGAILVPLQETGYVDSQYGKIYVVDNSLFDNVFGEGAAAALGVDMTQTGYIGEDGNYYFGVAYICEQGAFGSGYEVFYPKGAPASESALSVNFDTLHKASVPANLSGAIESVKRVGVDYEFTSARNVSSSESTLNTSRSRAGIVKAAELK